MKTECSWFQPHVTVGATRRADEGGGGKLTSAAITGWWYPRAALRSSCSHMSLRRSSVAARFSSSSSKLFWQVRSNLSSKSWNIFRTFIVTLRTDWFQCQRVFRSRAGYIIGRITWRFWEIISNRCSLFHRNKALSATYKKHAKEKQQCLSFKGYIMQQCNIYVLHNMQVTWTNRAVVSGRS